MELSLTWPVFAITAVLTLFVWRVVVTTRQYLRLRHINGPFLAAFTRWYLPPIMASGRAYLKLYDICEQYGDLVRVGPNEVLSNDPELIKRTGNVRAGYLKSDGYHALRFNPLKDNLLSQTDEEKRNKLRSQMAAGYSGKEVDDLEDKIDSNILRLVELISKYAAVGKSFDFGDKASFFTIDTISDIAFGEPFGDLTTDSDVYDYMKELKRSITFIATTTTLPWIMTLMKLPFFSSLTPNEADVKGFGKAVGIAKKITKERFGVNKRVQQDMLGSFIARGLTQEQAESEILVQIIAGSDTVATTIRATMLYLVANPKAVQTLRAEINSTRLSWPVITHAEAQEMPYLQAIIKEGLRMWPPIVHLAAKMVPKGGDTFKGTVLPEGTRVSQCLWGLMRRKDVWGSDANEFRPERWLDAEAEKLKAMLDTVDLVFSTGKWQCLGRNIAQMELNKIFVELLRRFDFTVVNPAKPWEMFNAGVFIISQFWLKASKIDIPTT